MKATLAILALTALFMTGCAGHQGGDADRDALLDCRAKADEQYKARYSTEWEAAVQQCLKQKAE